MKVPRKQPMNTIMRLNGLIAALSPVSKSIVPIKLGSATSQEHYQPGTNLDINPVPNDLTQLVSPRTRDDRTINSVVEAIQ